MQMSESKHCGQCRILKPMHEYARDRSKKDGRGYYCNSCKSHSKYKDFKKDPIKKRKCLKCDKTFETRYNYRCNDCKSKDSEYDYETYDIIS